LKEGSSWRAVFSRSFIKAVTSGLKDAADAADVRQKTAPIAKDSFFIYLLLVMPVVFFCR
jgi:hypothetical protein